MARKRVLAFAVRPAADGALELDVYDSIGSDGMGGGTTASAVLDALRAADGASQIRLRISSLGGDAFEGVAIHNLLRSASAKGSRVIVDIDGIAASAASIVAVAGDEIRIAPNAMIMIHSAWTVGIGNAEQLDGTAQRLRQCDAAMAETYAECSKKRGKNKPKSEFLEAMTAETWMTAEQAVEWGLADTITSSESRIAACLRPEEAALFRNAPKHLFAAAEPPAGTPPPTTEIQPMKEMIFAKILAALGAEDEAEALVNAEKSAELVTGAKGAIAVVEALCSKTGKPIAEAMAVVEAWQVGASQVPALQARVAELESAENARAEAAKKAERDSLIKDAIEVQGKLTVAQRAWAETQTADQLRAYLEHAPIVIPNAGARPVAEPQRSNASLSPEEIAVADKLGITHEAFAEAKAARAVATPHDMDE